MGEKGKGERAYGLEEENCGDSVQGTTHSEVQNQRGIRQGRRQPGCYCRWQPKAFQLGEQSLQYVSASLLPLRAQSGVLRVPGITIFRVQFQERSPCCEKLVQ